MSFIKSSFDGIGTGAGVAWPFFGILSSTLGLAVGGTVALIAGSVAGLLFCLISGAIFYLSYKNALNEKVVLQGKLERQIGKLNHVINLYLEGLYQKYLLQHEGDVIDSDKTANIISFLKIQIAKDSNKRIKHPVMYQLFDALLTEQADYGLLQQFVQTKITMLQDPSQNNLSQAIQRFTDYIIRSMPIKSAPITSKAQAAFFSAAGTFGAIAGCTAGFVGLLSGLGLLAGFAAIPILGWATLATAIILAAYVALQSVEQVEERFQIQEISSTVKDLYKNVNEIHLQRKVDLKANKIAKNICLESQYNLRDQTYPFFKPEKEKRKKSDYDTRLSYSFDI